MENKVNWGVLGAAGIAEKKAIPGIIKSESSHFYGVASRSKEKLEVLKKSFGEFTGYSSYEDMLDDEAIQAVYIPLPNHLHVEWIKKCVERGKHVLCEKPIALTSMEIKELIHLREKTGLQIGEAFMVRSQPRWLELKDRINKGEFGKLELIQGAFTYYNMDEKNVRNAYKIGGGGMWDIGCYLIQFSRFMFGKEPSEISCLMGIDKQFDVDRLASAWIDFPNGQTSFQVATQLFRSQYLRLVTDKCWIDMPMPFNPPDDRDSDFIVHYDQDPDRDFKVYSQPLSDQFALQFENFSASVLGRESLNIKLEDSYGNTRTLEAAFESARTGSIIQI